MNAALKGMFVAGSVAALFGCASKGGTPTKEAPQPSGTTTAAAAAGPTVKCLGINTCHGQSECATGDHECATQNSCSGKGWIKVSAEECAKKGGKEI